MRVKDLAIGINMSGEKEVLAEIECAKFWRRCLPIYGIEPGPQDELDRGLSDRVREPANRQGAALFNQDIDLFDHRIASKTVLRVRL